MYVYMKAFKFREILTTFAEIGCCDPIPHINIINQMFPTIAQIYVEDIARKFKQLIVYIQMLQVFFNSYYGFFNVQMNKNVRVFSMQDNLKKI